MPARPPLPEFDELWSRAAALAVAFRAIGIEDVWRLDRDGLHHDDGGGNTAHLVPLADGRGVVHGHDHEYSDTITADPPLDLLQDGPGWLPWDLLVPPAEADELGFCRWWDGEAWATAGPAASAGPPGAAPPAAGKPQGPLDDGLHMVLRDVAGDAAAAAAALVEVATTWRGTAPETAQQENAIGAAAAELLEAARTATVSAPHVRALLARAPTPDTETAAALAIAAACGVADGAARPVRVTRSNPATRRVRRLSAVAHDAVIHEAMAAEPERPRPVNAGPHPAPGRLGRLLGRTPWSPAERALLDHVRTRLPLGTDRGVLLALVTTTWATTREDPEHPLAAVDGVSSSDAQEARRLREADGDPPHGRWFFLRAEVGAPDGDRIGRAYDGIPTWWAGGPGQRGPGRDELRVEADRRDPAWHPTWTPLLDGRDVAVVDVPVPAGG